MTFRSTSSRMARSPRAPVPRRSAWSATASRASSVNSSSTSSSSKNFLYCFTRAFLGSTRIRMSASWSRLRHGPDHGEAADELGDETELEEVLRQHRREDGPVGLLVVLADVGGEADALGAEAALDDLLDPGEGTAADEEDVRGVDLDELLVRVLAPTLRRHRGGGALQDLQQRLLHALAGHVTGDRRVLALAGDLVDLVDVDDPGLGLLDVVVGGLDQLEEDVLDVLADVAGLGERGGIGDGERHVEHPGQRLRQQRLAAAGRAQQHDVRLGQLDVVVVRGAELHALVVVVDGDRQDLLGVVLPDDVVVQELVDLTRLRELVEAQLRGLGRAPPR